MTHIELLQLTTNPFVQWFRRRRLRAQLETMEFAAGHFAEMASMGHRGEAWAHKQIANIKPQLADLES